MTYGGSSLLRVPAIRLIIMLAACTPEGRLPQDDSVASAIPLASPTTTTAREIPNSLVGDTLELISIGGRRLPDPRTPNLPCDSARTPLLQRHVFDDDSTYSGITVVRPGCRDELVSSSDTLVVASSYEVRGDTLRLYVGDGDEIFQSYNGRIFPDSVVQLFTDDERNVRYLRRRARSHRDK